MKKQYISPSFIEVKLQGVGIIAGSDARITGDTVPVGEDVGSGNFGGDDDAWNDAAVKGFTSQDLWANEW